MKNTNLGQRLLRASLELMPQAQRAVRAWDAFHGRYRRDAYQGAGINRLVADWMATTLSPDSEVKWSIRRLRARARDLARNDGYAKHFVRLVVTNVIGPMGFKLKSRVRRGDALDKDTNATIETGWTEWCKSRVTTDGKMNFREAQVLALRSMVADGEVLVRFMPGPQYPHGLALQLIDADMLDESLNRSRFDGQNEIRMGIEVNELGRPLAYHFFADTAGRPGVSMLDSSRRVRIPEDEILHLFSIERPNQTRGVTWLHAGMYPLKMLNGYQEAELVAARVAAAKMGFIVSQEGVTGEASDTTTPAVYEAAPGTMEELPSGKTFLGWDPVHPVAAFGPFVKACLRWVASAFGVSYNGLGNDLEGVNYSSLRDGRLTERDAYRMIQEHWIDQFIRPVYAAWMRTALMTGALELATLDPAAYAPFALWRARGWQWVDPLKDIAAAEKEIGLGVNSRTRICAESGDDFEEIAEELADEREIAEELGISIDGFDNAAAATLSNQLMQDDATDQTGGGQAEDDDEPPAKKTPASKNGRHIVPARRF